MRSHVTGGAAGCSGEIPAVPAEWAGWERVTGNCDWPVYYTADPGLVPALTWSPCEGIDGCLQLETPWNPASVAPIARHTSYGRGGSGEWLVLTQEHPNKRRITAVFALHEGGRVVGAFGHLWGNHGGIPVAIRGDRLLAIFAQPVPDDENNVRYDFYHGPIDEPATYRKPAFSGSTADTYGAIQEIALADGTLGTGYAGGAIGLTDLTTHAVSYITTPTAAWRDKERVVAHGSALVFLELDDTGNALWSWRPGGVTERVRKAAHGVYVGMCDATGDDLAWLEASEPDGGYFGRHDLWVSPFATREAELKPRHVSRITGLKVPFTDLKSNDGQVAVITSEQLGIYDATGGVVRGLPRAPVTTGCSDGSQCFENTYTDVLFVNSNEVIAPIGWYSNVRSIVRLQLANLPATPVDSTPPGDGGGAEAPGDAAEVD